MRKIEFTADEVRRMVQVYLNEHEFKSPVTVEDVNVTDRTSAGGFTLSATLADRGESNG